MLVPYHALACSDLIVQCFDVVRITTSHVHRSVVVLDSSGFMAFCCFVKESHLFRLDVPSVFSVASDLIFQWVKHLALEQPRHAASVLVDQKALQSLSQNVSSAMPTE